MSDLNENIKDQIDLITRQAKKELDYINKNNWVDISNLKRRETEYKLQDLLNNRNINALVKFYNLAKEDLNNKEVKDTIRILLTFYYTLDERFNDLEKRYDWTAMFDEDDEKSADKKREEIEFQSEVLKNLTKYKEDLRKINFGNQSNEVALKMHSDIPVPFMMRERVEERYPEVKELMDRKLNGDV